MSPEWESRLILAGILLCVIIAIFALVHWGQKSRDDLRTELKGCRLSVSKLASSQKVILTCDDGRMVVAEIAVTSAETVVSPQGAR
jgi:hypothetical protein